MCYDETEAEQNLFVHEKHSINFKRCPKLKTLQRFSSERSAINQTCSHDIAVHFQSKHLKGRLDPPVSNEKCV